MQHKPLFSVLIANYNNGRYLMEAIESVRQQTYTNWEIILVDDASIDNSKELYKELEKDKRIHIYYNEQNMGCGYTKRRCAELANGELCGFLDPDDALLPEALEIMVKEHSKHQEASLINATYYIADADLQIVSESSNECQIPSNSSFLEYGRGISVFAAYKKEFYDKTDGIGCDLKRAIDHDLYFKLEEVGATIYIDRPLYIYRQGTGNNISLGDNSLKALYWDYIVRVDACRRRGVSIEKVVFPYFDLTISDVCKEEVLKKEIQICNSKPYKVGKLLLTPFKIIKSAWQTHNQ